MRGSVGGVGSEPSLPGFESCLCHLVVLLGKLLNLSVPRLPNL